MFLLTRPQPKLTASVSAFSQADIRVVGVATSDIAPLAHATQSLCQFFSSNHPIDAVIVTSVYSATPALNALKLRSESSQPPSVIAVGDATAALLKQSQFLNNVFIPSQQTSEGILTMQQLNEENCKHVVIIKGEGGRNAIAAGLQARGIETHEYCVYKRVQLNNPIYTKPWKISDVRGIIATSENMAKQFIASHSKQLLTVPWLTVSDRIATTLRHLGIHNVAVCQRATDQALIAWIKENWEY